MPRLLLRSGLFIAAFLGVPLATSAAPSPAGAPQRIEVRFTAAPLSEVLDKIARETGMKVTYEGGTPRSRVTTDLASVTPAQAVVSVLEGLGLNYFVGLDRTSTRVETLLVVSPAGSRTASNARTGSSMRNLAPRPAEAPEEPEQPEEPEAEEPMAGAISHLQSGGSNDPAALAAPPPGAPDPTDSGRPGFGGPRLPGERRGRGGMPSPPDAGGGTPQPAGMGPNRGIGWSNPFAPPTPAATPAPGVPINQ